jgi:hypothetical protein
LSWGNVPGGARAGKNYFDKQALESQIGDLEANAEYTREATSGFGALRWSGGRPFSQDRNTGDWNQLSASDVNQVMHGSRSEESSSS